MVHIHNGILSAIKRSAFESVLMKWMNLEPIIQSEVSQKEKTKYCIFNAYIWSLINLPAGQKWKHRQRTDLWTWMGGGRKERVRLMKREAWKHTLPNVK